VNDLSRKIFMVIWLVTFLFNLLHRMKIIKLLFFWEYLMGPFTCYVMLLAGRRGVLRFCDNSYKGNFSSWKICDKGGKGGLKSQFFALPNKRMAPLEVSAHIYNLTWRLAVLVLAENLMTNLYFLWLVENLITKFLW